MVKIICEIGKNFIDHLTDDSQVLFKAKHLILNAKESGADICKFQAHVFEDEKNKRSEERYDWIKRNEKATPIEFWKELKDFCVKNEIGFLITPMSKMAAEKVNDLVDSWKISSADLVDLEMLRYIADTKKPVILSTGMSTMPEIMKALDILSSHGSKITLVHCRSIYPCSPNKLNLNTIKFFKKGFPNYKIGFSDHSLSTFAPCLAVACGAELIEKHFTLDRNAYGPDHKCSLLPKEFKKMVNMIRDTEQILGKEEKTLLEEEIKFWENFRVS